MLGLCLDSFELVIVFIKELVINHAKDHEFNTFLEFFQTVLDFFVKFLLVFG